MRIASSPVIAERVGSRHKYALGQELVKAAGGEVAERPGTARVVALRARGSLGEQGRSGVRALFAPLFALTGISSAAYGSGRRAGRPGARTMMDLLGVYVQYCAGFGLRYVATAGPIYVFFYLWRRPHWTAYQIQPELPRRADVVHELRWSVATMVCSGITAVALYELVGRGWTHMYFDLARHGWGYFAFSVAVGIVGYDTWFYWQHRLLHRAWWFRHVHSVHHRVSNPTPFGNFALHPVEALMGAACFLLFAVVVPVHPIALALVSTYVFGWGMIAHLSYELYPAGFTRHPLFRWLNTATFHNMHHRQVTNNFGSIFGYWDRLMGTTHPGYHATFDAIKARVALRAIGGGAPDAVQRRSEWRAAG
jgi:sterol desaturase/sphingolipid hydroxylase (fatty acid hydroxylase superfamily)